MIQSFQQILIKNKFFIIFFLFFTFIARVSASTQPPSDIQSESSKLLKEIVSQCYSSSLFKIFLKKIDGALEDRFVSLASKVSGLESFSDYIKVSKKGGFITRSSEKIKLMQDRLVLLAIALKEDSQNSNGYMAEDIENSRILARLIAQPISSKPSDYSSLDEKNVLLSKGNLSKVAHLLAACDRIVGEYILQKASSSTYKTTSSDSFNILKSIYFAMIYYERLPLDDFTTKQVKKIVENNKKAASEIKADDLTTDKILNNKFLWKEFTTTIDIREFVESEQILNLNEDVDRLLEKTEIFEYLFRLGFVFFAYSNEFDFMRLEAQKDANEKVEYIKFISKLLLRIIQVHNVIETKVKDKHALRAFLTAVLMSAFKMNIFADNKGVFESGMKKSGQKSSPGTDDEIKNIGQEMQALILFLANANLCECILHEQQIQKIRDISIAAVIVITTSLTTAALGVIPGVGSVTTNLIGKFTDALLSVCFQELPPTLGNLIIGKLPSNSELAKSKKEYQQNLSAQKDGILLRTGKLCSALKKVNDALQTISDEILQAIKILISKESWMVIPSESEMEKKISTKVTDITSRQSLEDLKGKIEPKPSEEAVDVSALEERIGNLEKDVAAIKAAMHLG